MLQERGRLTRERVLHAASEVFDDIGYGAATLTAIRNRVGEIDGSGKPMTTGAFYHHFPKRPDLSSKEQLALEVFETTVTTDGVRPQAYRLQEVVDVGLVMAYRLCHESWLRAALRLSIDRSLGPLYGEVWKHWTAINLGQLTDAQECNELLPNAEPALYAEWIAGSWAGLALVGHSIYKNHDRFQMQVAFMYTRMLTGLAAPGLEREIEVTATRGRRLWQLHLEETEAAAADH